MNTQVYVKGDYGMDTLIRTLGTLRRKQVDVLDVYSKDIENDYSDIFITLKDKDYNAAKAVKKMLEKLYCLQKVEIID
ncbi:hypothetical protein QUF55_03755 [Clostridiaceae bacterium HSG29]|nr:hypothetical protein [Clostridiaceae bacterium HSG29]